MMKLKELLNEVDSLKAELDQLRPIPTDRMERLMQKLRLDWDYNSNSIEGNSLSLNETRVFLQSGLTVSGKPFRDYVEMKGHHEALKKLEQLIRKESEEGKKLKITESLIKDFHEMIIVESYNEEGHEVLPGKYKTKPNYLEHYDGERLDFEAPEDVPPLMNELINWLNNHLYPEELNRHTQKKYAEHPLVIACMFHMRFIMIHPFADGNGRMARILMNLILMQQGYIPAIVRLEQKQAYFDALNLSTNEDPTPLVEYIAQQEIESLKLALKAARGESVAEAVDLDKQLEMLDRKLENLSVDELKVVKSPESIRRVVELSFLPLIERLMASFSKFRKYYQESLSSIYIDGTGNQRSQENFTSYLGERLNENRDFRQIEVDFLWRNFKKAGLNAFDDHFEIKFYFYKHKYEISYPEKKDNLIEKLYNQFLSEEELQKIVLESVQGRIKHINNKIEELEKNKP